MTRLRNSLFFSILLASATAHAQQGGAGVWKKVAAFIPAGYDTLADGYVVADLNKDGKQDVVLALHSAAEEEKNPEAFRPLMVLLADGDRFKLLSKSNGAVMCKGCGGIFGDPWAGIFVERGVLHVNHYGGSAWRWSSVEKFRYQQGGMVRIGSTSDYFHNVSDCDGEGVGGAGQRYKDINFVTGQQEIMERDDDCKLTKHTKGKVPVKPLVRLENFPGYN